MSGTITDFFKPKKASTNNTDNKNSKKRKYNEFEDKGDPIDPIEPSKSGIKDTTSATSGQPAQKRNKLTETKEESDDEDLKQDDKKQKKASIPITYANCDELLDKSWTDVLRAEFEKPYFVQLRANLATEQKKGVEIFPPVKLVFSAFSYCPWDALSVVIIGQDPYHDNKQAEGLCFSVPKGIKIPSSLRNMYKEAGTDIGFKSPGHGNLIQWAQQGILLLNTVLTVQAHKANSHKKFGWQKFTDAVIQTISDKQDCVVFILWGAQAQKKKKIIDVKKHKIVESPHPSGLSAHRGFYGSKPYSKCNAFLAELGKEAINWQIDPSK